LIAGSETQPTDNPHNEYLFITVQSGLVGGGLFIALLLSLLFHSARLPSPRRYLLQGVVVAMAVGCLMNSFLFDSHQGHFFAIIAAVLSLPGRATPALQLAGVSSRQEEWRTAAG
jgi:O-antigen ligase